MAGSPWGQIQHSKVIKRGIRLVSTAGHGGAMVTLKSAEKNLSEAARKRGFRYGDYLCYEEDCDMGIVIFECKDVWAEIYKSNHISPETTERTLMKSLSMFHPEYLIERGLIPYEEEYNTHLEWKEKDRLRSMNSPDLIISASRVDEHKDIISVRTADGKSHLIYREGYPEMKLKLLSKCKIYRGPADEAI